MNDSNNRFYQDIKGDTFPEYLAASDVYLKLTGQTDAPFGDQNLPLEKKAHTPSGYNSLYLDIARDEQKSELSNFNKLDPKEQLDLAKNYNSSFAHPVKTEALIDDVSSAIKTGQELAVDYAYLNKQALLSPAMTKGIANFAIKNRAATGAIGGAVLGGATGAAVGSDGQGGGTTGFIGGALAGAGLGAAVGPRALSIASRKSNPLGQGVGNALRTSGKEIGLANKEQNIARIRESNPQRALDHQNAMAEAAKNTPPAQAAATPAFDQKPPGTGQSFLQKAKNFFKGDATGGNPLVSANPTSAVGAQAKAGPQAAAAVSPQATAQSGVAEHVTPPTPAAIQSAYSQTRAAATPIRTQATSATPRKDAFLAKLKGNQQQAQASYAQNPGVQSASVPPPATTPAQVTSGYNEHAGALTGGGLKGLDRNVAEQMQSLQGNPQALQQFASQLDPKTLNKMRAAGLKV